MAVLYVDDGGDDSDGSTWAKAYQSIENAAVQGAAAGSTIYIGSDHQETKNGASYTIDFANGTLANPIIIISADRTSGEPPATYESMADGGGFIQTTGAADDLTLLGHLIAHGLKTDVEDVTVLGEINTIQRYRDCYIDSVDELKLSGNAESRLDFTGCTIDTPNDKINAIGSDWALTFTDCVLDTSGAIVAGNASFMSRYCLFQDCDLSAHQTIWQLLTGNRQQVTVRRCVLHADTLTDPIAASAIAHPDTWILIESSAPGVDTVPVAGLNLFVGYYGRIEHDEVEYRTGGASDGETSYSWKMTCNTNTVSRHAALRTPPITAWKDAGSQTLTVYVAHDAVGDGAAGDLQDDECWLEISSPDETANPNTTARDKYQDTLPATVLTAASDLTNEGADHWQGSPTTYQQITATIDPAEAGPIVVRVCLATGASSIVWVDPKLHLS